MKFSTLYVGTLISKLKSPPIPPMFSIPPIPPRPLLFSIPPRPPKLGISLSIPGLSSGDMVPLPELLKSGRTIVPLPSFVLSSGLSVRSPVFSSSSVSSLVLLERIVVDCFFIISFAF